MAIDFETEGQITETVATRKAGGRPSILVSLLLITLAGSALGYAWYVTYVRPGQKQSADAEEAFNTARTAPNLTIEVPSAPKDNLLKLPPPAQEPTVPATEAAVAPPVINVAPAPPVQAVDDGEAKRLAELERLRKEAAAKRLARLQSNMIVVDGQVQTGGVAGNVAGAPTNGNGSDREEDPNRRFLSNTAAQAVELVGNAEQPDRCPDPSGDIDTRRARNSHPIGPARHGPGRDLDRRLVVRWPADLAAQGHDADGRIQVGPVARPDSHPYRLDASTARRWRVGRPRLVWNGRSRPLRCDG